MIGGSGEKKTLRLVARYADACNLFANNNEELARKLSILRRHCEEVNRPYEEIERTVVQGLDLREPGAVARLIKRCQELSSLGFQRLIVSIANVHEIKPLEIMGREVIPIVAEFGS